MSNLKRYQCIKRVQAEPMKYGEFVMKYRDGHGSSSMATMSDGYHVVSQEGGNDEFHSWIPEELFVTNYIRIVDVPDLTHEERAMIREMQDG